MGEIWDSNSSIEEKHSISLTPQIDQFRINFNILEIYDIIKKYQSNRKLEENDYKELCWFLDSEYAEQFNELSKYVKDLFGDKLKEEYFKIKLNDNKDKIQNYKYQKIYNYFLENELNEEHIDTFQDFLYEAMQKIPELFNDDMLSDEYKEKLYKILPIDEIKKRDKEQTTFKEQTADFKKTDILYQKKLLNELFKKEILKNIPQDYSDLEKSIYIYIKLCQLLSYDPNYYANKDKYIQEHQDFSNISKIGVETNTVICYEFVTIYSEMLKDMGLNVVSTTSLDLDVDENDKPIYTSFADKHSNLQYSVDDIIVFSDSTSSVLGGDIINAKMNNQLNGLKCLSVEQDKKDEFNNALNKVYNGLKIENTIFKKYGKDVKEKLLVEKLKMLFDDISNTNFNSTDFVSYIANIKHELFTDNELDWNIKISFIGKNSEDNQYPVALFSVNTNDIKNVKGDTVQYLYDSHEKSVSKIEKSELEKMFIDGTLFFLDEKINIPNVNTSQSNNSKSI